VDDSGDCPCKEGYVEKAAPEATCIECPIRCKTCKRNAEKEIICTECAVEKSEGRDLSKDCHTTPGFFEPKPPNK